MNNNPDSASPRRRWLATWMAGHRPRSQEEIRTALRQAGHRVGQATVSRDLRELRAAKVGGVYLLSPPPGAALPRRHRRVLAEEIADWEVAGDHLLIVRTPPGGAHRVGAALDALRWEEIVGTVAGDDTLFVAVGSRKRMRTVQRRLREIAGGTA